MICFIVKLQNIGRSTNSTLVKTSQKYYVVWDYSNLILSTFPKTTKYRSIYFCGFVTNNSKIPDK